MSVAPPYADWRPGVRNLFVNASRLGASRPTFKDVEVPESARSNSDADAALAAAGWVRTAPWERHQGMTRGQIRWLAAVERTSPKRAGVA